MWNPFSKKKSVSIASPVSGKVIRLEETNDEAFASGALGSGFAIEFCGENVISPIAGLITFCFPSGHAIGIQAGELEVIVHIGIDTVNLNGDGFHVLVKQGENVKKGDILVKVDSNYIQEKGYDPTTMVLFPNHENVDVVELGNHVEAGKSVASWIGK